MKNEMEKQAAGEIYHSGDPEFIRVINRARDLTLEYNALKSDETEARKRILHDLLGKVGHNAYVDTPFYCDFGINTELATMYTSDSTARSSTAERSRLATTR